MNKLRHYIEIESKFVDNFIRDAIAFMEDNDVRDMLEIIVDKSDTNVDIRAVSYEIATIMEVVIKTLLKQSRSNGCPRYSYLVLETSGHIEKYDFVEEIALVYGMSKQNVYNICGGKVAYPRGVVIGIYTDAGRKNERKNAKEGPSSKYSDEDISRAMYLSENNYEMAAEILGCHVNTVKRRWRTLCSTTKDPDLN